MKKQQQNDYLIVLVPTFIVVFAWIIFNIYQTSITSTISESVSVQIQPLDPHFDQPTIDTVKKRLVVSPRLLAPSPSVIPTQPAAPTVTPTTTPTNATPTPGVSANDQGSISAPIPTPIPTTTTGGTP